MALGGWRSYGWLIAVSDEDWEYHADRDNLEQHPALLLKSSMDALSLQIIHPIFFSNTLNTVRSSLIRTIPEHSTRRGH